MPLFASRLLPARAWTSFGAAVVAASMALAIPSGASALDALANMRLFGYGERTTLGIAEFPKWTQMLGRYEHEKMLEAQVCTDVACGPQKWRAHLRTLAGQDKFAQLRAVNTYVNGFAFRTDPSNYGVPDFWSTPRQLFARGGDCEDFAIAKFLSLRQLGWNMDYVRVVVTMHEQRRELHAILAVKAEGTIWILDNLLPEPVDHRQLTYYRPIFSLNEHAWWLHSRPGAPGVASVTHDAEPGLLARGGCETTGDFVAAVQAGRDPEWPRFTRAAR